MKLCFIILIISTILSLASAITAQDAVALMAQPLACFNGIAAPAGGSTAGVACNLMVNITCTGLRDNLFGYSNVVLDAYGYALNRFSCDVNHGYFCAAGVTASPCIGVPSPLCPSPPSPQLLYWGAGIDAEVDTVTAVWTGTSITTATGNAVFTSQPTVSGGSVTYHLYVTASGTGTAVLATTVAGNILTPATSIPVGTTGIQALIGIEMSDLSTTWILPDYGTIGAVTSKPFSTQFTGILTPNDAYNVSMIMVERAVSGGGNGTWRQIYGGRALQAVGTTSIDSTVALTLHCAAPNILLNLDTVATVSPDGTFSFSFATAVDWPALSGPHPELPCDLYFGSVLARPDFYDITGPFPLCTPDDNPCTYDYAIGAPDSDGYAYITCGYTAAVTGATCPAGYCNAQAVCVQCLSTPQCEVDQVCSSAGSCVQCNVDNDCTGGQYCSAQNTCVACTLTSQCGTGLVCSPSGTCVACYSDAQCTTGVNLHCSAQNLCVQCTLTSQCGTGLVCSPSGTCVACYSDAQCTTGTATHCSAQNTCVQCLQTSQCGTGLVCSTAGSCVQCNTANDCTAGGCAGTCTSNVCHYACRPNCVHEVLWWLLHVHDAAVSVNPRFIPITLGGSAHSISITTQATLQKALLGWNVVSPISALISQLTVTKLNIIKGAIPPTNVAAAIVSCDAVINSCLTLSTMQWIGVLLGATRCANLNAVGIIQAGLAVSQFNCGVSGVPKCPTNVFPY